VVRLPAHVVRALIAGEVAVLAYGTVAHVYQLATSGGHPYPWAPTWLRAYFVALTVLDPLAAVRLARRRRGGLHLAVAVLVTDAAANGYASYALPVGTAASRVGQAVITVLAGVALATAAQVRPWLGPVRGGSQEP
jgi:hypothetical protein